MIHLNYHHLYYFYVIAREGSISKAGKILFLAQPTLSSQLKKFEKSLKTELFKREGKRLHLTETGQTVYQYAKRMFDLGSEMTALLDGKTLPETNRLHLGVVKGLPKEFSQALLETVLGAFPGASIKLEEDSFPHLIEDLQKLRLDIVLTETPVSPGEELECESKLVGKIPLVFAARPELAGKFKKNIDQKEEIPIILPTNPPQVYSQIKDLLGSGKLKPRIIAEVQDAEVARLLALKKRGIAPVNQYSMTGAGERKSLTAVKWIFPEPIYENLYLVIRKRNFPNNMARFLFERFKIISPSKSTGKRK